METYSISLWIASFFFEGTILFRGRRARLFTRFPFFYSYLGYVFGGSLLTFLIYRFDPKTYARVFWFYLLVSLLAEFAVFVEISDHAFEVFPAIRRLGRLIAAVISVACIVVYVGPGLFEPRSSGAALFVLVVRVSLTKAAVIAVLALAIRWYRLPLSRNIAGLMVGFAIYLSVYVTSFAAARIFGRGLYADLLRLVPPHGYTLCLLVWTVTMWRFEPVRRLPPQGVAAVDERTGGLRSELARFNDVLTRLLRK